MALPVLYEIAKDYKDALEELSDLEDEAVLDTLEGLKGTLEAKSENIIKYTQNLNGTIKAMKEAEKIECLTQAPRSVWSHADSLSMNSIRPSKQNELISQRL